MARTLQCEAESRFLSEPDGHDIVAAPPAAAVQRCTGGHRAIDFGERIGLSLAVSPHRTAKDAEVLGYLLLDIDADAVLDLLAVTTLAAVTGVNELATRCACIFRSLDEPDLYFPAVGLEGFGATSWNFAIMARSVMSHICGRALLDQQSLPYRLNHLEMVRHLAQRDPLSFGGVATDTWCRDVGLGTPDDQPYPMP